MISKTYLGLMDQLCSSLSGWGFAICLLRQARDGRGIYIPRHLVSATVFRAYITKSGEVTGMDERNTLRSGVWVKRVLKQLRLPQMPEAFLEHTCCGA